MSNDRLSRTSLSSGSSGRLSQCSIESACSDSGGNGNGNGRMSHISEGSVETESPRKALEIPVPPLTGEALLSFLQPYGYVARDANSWLDGCVLPEISLSVTGHSKASGSTHYNVECSLAVRGQWHTPYLNWCARRRLAHLREGLHDPVKQMLGVAVYKNHFGGAPFAHGYAVPGTTSRLNSWCRRLADALNSAAIPPSMTATVLRTLSVPPIKQNRGSLSQSLGSLSGEGLEDHAGSSAAAPPIFRGRAPEPSNPFGEGAAETNPFSQDVAGTAEDLNPFSSGAEKGNDTDLNPFSAELNGTGR
mmetsp:Transcript_69072/g.123014  ORF Transcript_69072/g.123014 Transcript_69072/m.123014 type:complete len:305 (-) Transcript_69072:67-981(-)